MKIWISFISEDQKVPNGNRIELNKILPTITKPNAPLSSVAGPRWTQGVPRNTLTWKKKLYIIIKFFLFFYPLKKNKEHPQINKKSLFVLLSSKKKKKNQYTTLNQKNTKANQKTKTSTEQRCSITQQMDWA